MARCGQRPGVCRCVARAAARLHLQPTDRCPAFHSLLHRPARPTGVITVVGAEVAGVSAAIGGPIVAAFMQISLHSLL